MKIAIYADDYIGNRGIANVGFEVLSRLLNRKDLTFIVIGYSTHIKLFNDKFQLNLKKKDLAIVEFHAYRFNCLSFIRKKFLDYLILSDVDIFWYMKNYGTYRFKTRAKVVVTVHDLMGFIRPDLQGGTRTITRTLRRKINVNTLKYADVLVSVSYFTVHEVCTRLGIDKRKFKVLHNSVDTNVFTLGKKEKILLYTGAFNKYKNVEFLIESFLRSDLVKYGWNLILCGPCSKIKGCIKEQLTDMYRDNKYVKIEAEVKDYKELVVLYKKAFCVVSASEYEGFGMSILEGMSSGAYILASKITPHMEILQDSVDSKLIKVSEPQAWLNALNDVESRFNLHSAPSYSNRELASRYTWDTVSDAYYKIFKQLHGK